ncbi:hypothetical protein [Lapidilactobacillus luobeiensis]|uniref:hypothetical protein n=1 Tax=Lapidilactobacillus luobeiensis TaxID=2950371 RepID=UPI0021C28E32|nr:hypothetical protein [Lapidilactobacillus luobeiensis]
MKSAKNKLKIVLGLIAVVVTLIKLPPDPLKAASYDTAILTDYGIPATVTQVLLDNSSYADGTTPSEHGETPATFTIADLQRLTTVSLAQRTKNADGSFSSAPDQTVATWVAGLKSGVDYNVEDGAYLQNTTALVEGENGSLVTKEITIYGAKATLSFNFLMQIIASATSATTVDLTGLTSQVVDTTLVEKLLCLFQTDRLSALQTLILAQNNFTSTVFYKAASTIFSTSAEQNITSLDLSDNNMDFKMESFSYADFPIVAKLTNLDLGGNDVTLVEGWLANALQKIVDKEGTSDLGEANLDTKDWNTVNTMLTIINSNSGELKMNDTTVNNLFLASATSTGSYPIVNKKAVATYLDQLNLETVNELLKNPSIANDSELTGKLTDKKSELTGSNAITVTGDLDFGSPTLEQINEPLKSSGQLTLTAMITSGSQLQAEISPWVGQRGGSTFNGTLTIPGFTGYWAETPVNSSAAVLYNNSSNSTVKFTTDLVGVKLVIPTEQQANVQSQNYQATVTWTISTVPENAS